jgi:heme exporter protein A
MADSTCIDGIAGLALERLSLVRGDRVLFRDLDLSVSAGEAVSLEGANGVGKTSLLRAIAGLLEPQAGRIRILQSDGGEIVDAEARGARAGWLGHQDGAKPQMTPSEILSFFARTWSRSADVARRLSEVGLSRVRDLPVHYLSAGQKRRLALARLILSERPLWLLDEPLSALDQAGRTLAAGLIEAHRRAGGIIVAATHEPLGLDCRRVVLTPAARTAP